MLSMDKSIMPQAYRKFSYSVLKRYRHLLLIEHCKYFGSSPSQIFDKFNLTSINAASIGQVHEAEKMENLRENSIPGVADISSDLKLVKPIAIKMFNIKGKDSDKYFQEVEDKLLRKLITI